MSATTLLRSRALRKPAGTPPFVLFTGGKGGVGKSILAANAAVALASRGHRVLLADLDLGLADLDVLLRLSFEHTIEDALLGRARFADCVVEGPGGVRVLGGSSGTAAMGRLHDDERAKLLAGLFELSRGHDVVIADGAAGIGPEVLETCALADHVLVVTTPEPTALTDAYGLVKALHQASVEHGRDVPTPEIVVNQSRSVEEAEHAAAKLRSVCERFLARSPRTAGWMPASTAVARSAALQQPFALATSDGLATGQLARFVARIERLALGAARAPVAQGKGTHGR